MSAAADWLSMTDAQKDAGLRAFREAFAAPDPEDMAYSEDDADADVAAALVEADEVTELVADMRGSLALLRWVEAQELPGHLRGRFRLLLDKARALDAMVDERMDAMVDERMACRHD